MRWLACAHETPVDLNDPLLDDASWLSAGHARFDALVPKYYGSPDSIAAGGKQRHELGDPDAALFFFQRAIDTLHTVYVASSGESGPDGWPRRPSSRDLCIVDAYLNALSEVRALRPTAPVRDSVVEVTHRLRTIASTFKRYGLDQTPYLGRLDALADLAPDVDVGGVFWS